VIPNLARIDTDDVDCAAAQIAEALDLGCAGSHSALSRSRFRGDARRFAGAIHGSWSLASIQAWSPARASPGQ